MHLKQIAIVGLLTLWGCSGNQPGREPPPCGPAPDDLVAEFPADSLVGRYRLIMVTADGDSVGAWNDGKLELVPYEPNLRVIRLPDGSADPNAEMALYGSVEIDMAAVGAEDTGDTESMDVMRPGVTVSSGTQGGGSSYVILRIGARSNRRGDFQFDGAYTALFVEHVNEGGFFGTWSSGSTTGQTAGGFFCAMER